MAASTEPQYTAAAFGGVLVHVTDGLCRHCATYAGTFAAAAAARVPGLARLFVSVAFEKGNHYDEPSKY